MPSWFFLIAIRRTHMLNYRPNISVFFFGAGTPFLNPFKSSPSTDPLARCICYIFLCDLTDLGSTGNKILPPSFCYPMNGHDMNDTMPDFPKAFPYVSDVFSLFFSYCDLDSVFIDNLVVVTLNNDHTLVLVLSILRGIETTNKNDLF